MSDNNDRNNESVLESIQKSIQSVVVENKRNNQTLKSLSMRLQRIESSAEHGKRISDTEIEGPSYKKMRLRTVDGSKQTMITTANFKPGNCSTQPDHCIAKAGPHKVGQGQACIRE